MNALIEAGRVWYVDCTPDNKTFTWNIAAPDQLILARVMSALWRQYDIAAKAAH